MQKPKTQHEHDPAFYKLAESVTKALTANKDGTDQAQQVEELMQAEKKFKEEILLRERTSTELYKKFLQRICVKNKNILSARPYFRESAKAFSRYVTPAIKANDIATLKTFDINFQFIKFIKDNWVGVWSKKSQILYDRVERARTILIQNNMPLAINRAKLFFRKVPKDHLSMMDMIEICAMGLSSGIDKYTGPYSKVWRSVCIGRMVGNLIEAYSETVIHFYPSDKRILYKANAIRSRQGITDIADLAAAVNASFAEDGLPKDGKPGRTVPKPVNVDDLSALMAAATMVSCESTVNEEGFGVYQYSRQSLTTIESPDAEQAMIEKEGRGHMSMAMKNLPLLQRKILRLKGISL